MNPSLPLILLVEDDPQLGLFLTTGLRSQDFAVCASATGQEGLARARAEGPQLLILDLGLPDMDGVELIRRLRKWSEMPIIVLSARSQESDIIKALDAGADDYITKPFSMAELVSRMRAILRRAARGPSGQPPEIFRAGELKVDLARRTVEVGGREIHLTPIEYRLLSVLIRHAGFVVTHRQLLKEVWGPAYVEHSHYVRIYLGQLRHKLEADPARPCYLLTEPGVGYRLVDEV